MISEECAINDHLVAHGITPVETDLGEYIIQLRGELPSHIIAPAVHVTGAGGGGGVPQGAHPPRSRARPFGHGTLQAEARGVLRGKYFEAEVGITGANMLIAETGHSVIVTNVGTAICRSRCPRVHIVMASLRRSCRRWRTRRRCCGCWRARPRGRSRQSTRPSPVGRDGRAIRTGLRSTMSCCSTTGGRTCWGRTFQDMLRCIRCGACMNHCPVYQAVGGHAYGWVYPGPMGAVLTPS
jgi:L-lactate dehydrogenase complex protein LldF